MSKRVPARCRKIRYANEAMALEALARLNRILERQGRAPLARAYQCPLCRGFHHTSKEKASARP